MPADLPRLSTGNPTLDAALGGGVRCGETWLVEGEEGAGATEFALTLLHHLARSPPPGAKATPRFASAMRAPSRVARELVDLFGAEGAKGVDLRGVEHQGADAMLSGLAPGSAVVVESTSALARKSGERALTLVEELADRAAEAGVLVILLSTPATMPRDVEAAIAELADGVLSFQWLESGTARRRILRVKKVRGLAPVLDNEQVPIYEVGLHRGRGFDISKVKSLI